MTTVLTRRQLLRKPDHSPLQRGRPLARLESEAQRPDDDVPRRPQRHRLQRALPAEHARPEQRLERRPGGRSRAVNDDDIMCADTRKESGYLRDVSWIPCERSLGFGQQSVGCSEGVEAMLALHSRRAGGGGFSANNSYSVNTRTSPSCSRDHFEYCRRIAGLYVCNSRVIRHKWYSRFRHET